MNLERARRTVASAANQQSGTKIGCFDVPIVVERVHRRKQKTGDAHVGRDERSMRQQVGSKKIETGRVPAAGPNIFS